MKIKDIALDGVVRQNPVLKLVLGTCPTLAVSTALANALGMGAAVIFVLICSNVLISLLRNVIPGSVRIPAFIMIIATFVTVVILAFEKFLPDLYTSLGMFLPLIVVNCIILARAEAFASTNTVGASALDGLFMGIGFTLALSAMAFIRELLGAGALFGVQLWDFKIGILTTSAGGFLVYGILIAAFVAGSKAISKKQKQKQAAAEKAAKLQAAEAVAASEAEVK